MVDKVCSILITSSALTVISASQAGIEKHMPSPKPSIHAINFTISTNIASSRKKRRKGLAHFGLVFI